MSKFRLPKRSTPRFRTALAVAALAAAGVVAGPAGPAAASTGEAQVVSADGTGLLIARQTDGTSTFKTQTVATGVYGQPSVVQESDGTTVIASVYLLAGQYRGTLYEFWEAAGSTTWHRQQVSALAAVSPNQQVVIAAQTGTSTDTDPETEIVAQDETGTGSTLYWAHLGSTTWHSEPIPNVSGTVERPYVTVDSHNTTVIGYTSTDGFGVDRQTYGSNSWETEQDIRPGSVMYGVQAMDEPDGEIAVAATNSAGQIYFFYDKTGNVTDWYGQYLGQFASNLVAMAVNDKEGDVTLAAFNPSFWDGQCISTYTAAFDSSSWAYSSCAERDAGYGIPDDVVIAAQPSGYLAMAANASNGEVQFFGLSPDSGAAWSDEQINAFGYLNSENIPGLAAD